MSIYKKGKLSWLKNKIMKWLNLSTIENDILNLEKCINNIQYNTNEKLQHNEELIKSFLATCQTGYDLGVSNYHKNWCVFVRQGKGQDFVKFIDLSDMAIGDIKQFEKHFELLNKKKK